MSLKRNSNQAASCKLTIATWFVGDRTGEESIFPQMGMLSSQIEFQRVYWQCIWLFFRSAKTTNPNANLILFVDRADHALCLEFASALEVLEVSIVTQPFLSRPPNGFTQTFGNQLYICDIVRYVSGQSVAGSDVWLILDSDCLIIQNLEMLRRETCLRGILTYDLNLPDKELINGLTQIDLGNLAFQMGLARTPIAIKYQGGEFFAATVESCKVLSPLLDRILEASILMWKNGEHTIREEAHLLSIAYSKLGVHFGSANIFIRRIWTTFKYSNATASDLELSIWHVPAEKRLGFARMYRYAMKKPNEFQEIINSTRFKSWAGEILGIPNRTTHKIILDITAKITQKLFG